MIALAGYRRGYRCFGYQFPALREGDRAGAPGNRAVEIMQSSQTEQELNQPKEDHSCRCQSLLTNVPPVISVAGT